ncbi:MAG: hypothetical protein KBT03_08890 [Bacteroidales bacterium]|nr:hypothetical protein [Candidatus Scybalousia scybalohippi]
MRDMYMGSEMGVSLPIIDSADTDRNVWSAQKTKNEIGIVDDKVKELQLYKFPNAIIYGQPTINNGQISGFSSANYLGLPFVFDTKDRGFEINVAFTTNSDVTIAQNIFGSKFCIALYIQNGQLVFRAGNGSDWSVADITTTLSVQANTTYYVKIVFNKLNYTISYSTNGEDYESIGSKVTTIPPTVGQVNIGIGNNQHNPFNGIINLNKTFIKLNNTVVWEGMDDVGLATRLATDLENIDEVGIDRIREIAETEGLKSSQGRNLITYPYWNQSALLRGIDYTVNDDGSVNCNGTASGGVANFVFFDNRTSGEPNLIKKDIEYTLSSTNQCPTRVNFAIRTYDSSKAVLEQFTVTNDLNNVKIKFTKDFVYSTIYIAIGEGVTVDNLVIYPMLEEGSSVHSYEPTVESNVGILSQEKLTQGRNLIPYPYYRSSGYSHYGITYTVNNDGRVVANGTCTGATSYFALYYVESADGILENGKQYTLSFEVENGDVNIYINNGNKDVSFIKHNINSRKTVTFTFEKGTKQVIGLYVTTGTTLTDCKIKVQLEEGTIAHAYEPTTESNVTLANTKVSIDDIKTSQGRNLIPYPYAYTSRKMAGVDFTILTDGGIKMQGDCTSSSYFYLVNSELPLKSGTYKLSGFNQPQSTAKGYVKFKDGTNRYFSDSTTLNITEDNPIVQIAIRPEVGTYDGYVVYPMFEVGNIIHAYEPTTESNVTLANRDTYTSDEKIVGTWIGGKPIYRKTVINNGTIENGTTTILDSVLKSNVVSRVISITGSVYGSNGTFYAFPHTSNGSEFHRCLVNSSGVYYQNNLNISVSRVVINIEYVKID